jgi:prolyl 4-hydroxylase
MTHFVANQKHMLHMKDSNGWQPIHEAARGGHLDIVQLLVEHGADVNERTHFGDGQSVLELVLDTHGHDHPLFDYLEGIGAEL